MEPEQILVITGMSGAGRSTVAHVLEDLGWYVVDNLPPALLSNLTSLPGKDEIHSAPRIAAVIDVRSRAFFKELRVALKELPEQVQVLFLEASDDVLVRRFESTRRPHPLQEDGRILDGIAKERELLGDLRAAADLVIDTSALNVHQLKERIESTLGRSSIPELRTTVLSFGFKYGIPFDADFVIDVRFIANPHWIPELRDHTGKDAGVRAYVLAAPEVSGFIEDYANLLLRLAPSYQREGKRYLTIGVGCTGGKHRSVAVVEELAKWLSAHGMRASSTHRDLGRE